MNLVLIGVPYITQAYQAGAEGAPSAWQAAGLMEQIAPLVSRALWVNLQAPDPDSAGVDQLIATARQLRETVSTVHRAGAVALILGGDPGLAALGAVAGLQRAGRQPGVAWFDGGDGFAPSEPLTLLTGRDKNTPSCGLEIKAIPEWRILIAGDRESRPEDSAAVDGSGATHWYARDLELAGASELGQDVADWPSVYLHLGLNVLSPAIMPAASKLLPGGLALETVIAGIESIAAANQIDAIGISGYNPERDQDGLGLETSLQVIRAAVRLLVL